jgi:hypothetical protein
VGVRNVHERMIDSPIDPVGSLIDGLGGSGDRLWPHDRWPALRLDRPLSVGARGGHGPIRYEVTDYERARRVRFAFTSPAGFHGCHEFTVTAAGSRTLLRHEIAMTLGGRAKVSWPLIFRPLHDALLEDALDRAEQQFAGPPVRPHNWSAYVRLVRRLASLGAASRS